MAAGQYVSVSSQSDIETTDLVMEKNELETMPHIELKELAKINGKKGITQPFSYAGSRTADQQKRA